MATTEKVIVFPGIVEIATGCVVIPTNATLLCKKSKMVFPLALSKFTGAEYPAKITVPFGFTCAAPTIPPKVPSPFVSADE